MKKYQIFISSTFTDLIDERQAAVEAILQAGHIPAGMELFAASNKSQLEIIKEWIDESDIYMLILGGRYGSIETDSGLSYTELEYNYACETDKPLFSLVLHDDFIEKKVQKHGSTNIREPNEPQKLKKFSTNVLSKLCKICSDNKDIQLGVFQSITSLEKEYKLTGWLPANQKFNPEIYLKQISDLTRELEKLRKSSNGLIHKSNTDITRLSQGEDNWIFTISFLAESNKGWTFNSRHEKEVSLSWNQIFSIISPVMAFEALEYTIHKALEESLPRILINDIHKFCEETNSKQLTAFTISNYYFETILIQLQILNLIKKSEKKRSVGDQGKYWSLTEYGENLMLELRSIKNKF